MDIDRGLINLIVLILFLGGSIVGPIVKALQRRRAMQRGEPLPPDVEPEDEEPADEPWLRPEPEPEPEPAPRRVFHREPPAPVPEPAPPPPLVARTSAAPPPPPERPRSLDDRIFHNPRLTPGARLVLSYEILQPPRSLRRPRS